MCFCYGIAWIFLFEMSHHMSLSAKYPGRSLNFPPAQSCFELSFGKAISDAGERAIFLHPPSMKSWVLLTSATTVTTPYQSALLVMQDILGRNSTPSVFQ